MSRRRIVPTLFAVAALLAMAGFPSRAAADPWTPVPGEKPTSGHDIPKAASDAYCKYVRGIADSDRALQMAPTLFASGGLVNPSDVTGGSTAVPTAARLTAGVQYSVAGLYRGSVLADRADGECATYRQLQELLAFIARNKEGLSEPALRARLKVYEDALPIAQAKVDAARARTQGGKLTAEDARTLEVRFDALRVAAIQAQRDASAIALTAASEDKPLRALLADYSATEKRAEEAQASVRKSYGWDLSLRGGYDHVFGAEQKVPAFAVATLSLNTGLLFQGSGNGAAVEARPVASRWALEGGGHPAVDALRKLRETGIAEQARLELVARNVSSLESLEKSARAIETERAQLLADQLFFDLVQARAEQAFLTAHVAHIAALTGDGLAGTKR